MAIGRKTGGGSRKGIPNKMTRAAREALALAFEGIGGVEALIEWAKKNQTEFYKLYARLIPVELHGAAADGSIVVEHRWPADVSPK